MRTMPGLTQSSLFDYYEEPCSAASKTVSDAVEELASNSGAEARGAIFTRREVVDFILDLVGYTPDRPLHRLCLLEPSFGGGDFLLAVIGRLLDAWRRESHQLDSVVDNLGDAIVAVELHHETFARTRQAVIEQITREGIESRLAVELADRWLSQGDYLLQRLGERFDFVVGNPPYVRQEMIPAPLLAEYRSRYQTMYDRADIYVAFMERSLLVLKNGGSLGFICADRWTKNRYGGPLRNLVSDGFSLDVFVDMVNTPAFHSEVSAYPAITIISRQKQGPTRVAHRPTIDRTQLYALAKKLRAERLTPDDETLRELAGVVKGSEPWLLDSSDQISVLRRLEEQFPSLERAGCKVGIGVATGADDAFISDYETLDVEPDRKLPLVTTRDIQSGEVVWRGLGVVNPFAEDGGLVDLSDYPRLARYLETRKGVIAARHCAQKSPTHWYRTIDRITPALAAQPKLLVPDIKGEAHIVYEEGRFYPHHNLYYIVSATWNLRALQAVLLSNVARLFVANYSTRMRGGYLRFQAQYLRRIRIPYWQDVADELRCELIEAAESRNSLACDRAVFRLYGLSEDERAVLGGNGE